MGRAIAERAEEVLELGTVSFYFRPRVEELLSDELNDVRRLYIVMTPEDSPFERLIAVGRKRIPRSHERERFWGFVDLVLTPNDMQMALGPQVYGTKTRGVRHLPAAQQFAHGTYDLAVQGEHTHFRWQLDEFDGSNPVATAVDLEHEADFILTVANPDPAAWGIDELPDLQSDLFDVLEVHVDVRTPFPPDLQRRFRDRRFAQVDATGWLEHPGAELV